MRIIYILTVASTAASVTASAVPAPPQFKSSHRSIISTITQFRNRIVNSIWKPNGEGRVVGNAQLTVPNSEAPPSLLARYGGDVVLRFKISTQEEAKALADATEVLFLDVWEFTSSWADIRLSKDVVCTTAD